MRSFACSNFVRSQAAMMSFKRSTVSASISVRSPNADFRATVSCSELPASAAVESAAAVSASLSETVKKLFAGGSPIDHEYAILAP